MGRVRNYKTYAVCLCILISLTSYAADSTAIQKLNFVSINSLPVDSLSCIIPFNRVGNLIVVKAKADTIEGNFILDTGAPGLVLNLTYFRHYPIDRHHDAEQTTIAGTTNGVQQTTIKEFSVGAMQYFRTEADLTNLGQIENAKGIKVLGLLGIDLFKQCEMIIDFEKSLIYLHRISKKEASTYSHDSLRDTSLYRILPIDLKNNLIITTTEIAGKKIKLAIDCASESNILDSRLPNKVFETITITRRVKLMGPGDKKIDAFYGNLSTIKMGSLDVINLPVTITNLEYTCFSFGGCVDGVLGFDFLSMHKVGFNFVNRKMYIWK
jgi:Aspartyl protease